MNDLDQAVTILRSRARTHGAAMATCGNGCVFVFSRDFLQRQVAGGKMLRVASAETKRPYTFSVAEMQALLLEPGDIDLVSTFVPFTPPAAC